MVYNGQTDSLQTESFNKVL